MRLSGTTWLAITSVILITITIFALMGFSFSWVFYLMCLGQAFLVISVIKVLKDDYTTEKTFDDFYEDRPDLGK